MTQLAYMIIILGLLFVSPAYADNVDWGKLSLDQLSNVEVTSVSKKTERAFDAAAAVYVITKEDIRRSGARSIPEALRLAPGVQVARSSANQWAIAIRGFNDQFSNKLLVLIDGRSVYTPLFSGVYWDEQDTMIEDVKQIEVIRGPGAALWGSNAVSGVINIITEDAANTQGKFVTATIGNNNKEGGSRVGGKIGDDAFYRIYAKYTTNAAERTSTGGSAGDSNYSARTGFRIDWDKNVNDMITVQGDVFSIDTNQNEVLPSLTPPYTLLTADNEKAAGGNIMAKWQHKYEDGADSKLQIYADNDSRYINYLKQKITTFDVDFQHSLPTMQRNEITLGTGYRLVMDNFGRTPYINLNPTDRNTGLYNAFVQDKIHLVEDALFLTLGTKYEFNSFTGNEIQPSARLSYLPTNTQTLWTSVSRAVRLPNRSMDNITFPVGGTPSGYFELIGDKSVGFPTVESEVLVAYEAGYRIQPIKPLTLDITAFYNDYSKLISNTAATPIELTPTNLNSGEAHGFEVSSKWEATGNWDVSANYTLFRTYLHLAGVTSVSTTGKSPESQYNLTSHYQFPHNIEMSNTLYRVGALPTITIPAYTRFDTNITWKATDTMELSLVGQNLLDNTHPEFNGFIYENPEWIGRTVYAKLKLVF